MASAQAASAKDILANVKSPRPLKLDFSVMKKGIDNYHVDIALSPDFVLYGSTVCEDVVKRVIGGKKPAGTPEDTDALRDAYEEMIKASLHRTKTDLTPDQVKVLHFGIIKFVIEEVRRHIDAAVSQLEEALNQQQYAGSRNLMVTQEKFTWIRHHYPTFLYQSTRAMLRLLQREENKVRQLRGQFLGDEAAELANAMFNPMLAAAGPTDPHLLMDSYAMWPGGGKGIGEANAELEKYFGGKLPDLKIQTFKEIEKIDSGQSEVYDALGGLFAAQPYLGPSPDQKDQVVETFSWLDHPGYMRFLFDPTVHERNMAGIEGKRAQWSFKSEAKKLVKIGAEARARLVSEADLRQVVAGYVIRDHWVPLFDELIDVPTACAYVAGQDSKKILARIDQSKEGAANLVKHLDEWSDEVTKMLKEEHDEISLRVLTDLSRFRLHLQYFRFAHRIFNRINIITEADQAHLSRAGGHLYELGDGEEDPEAAPKEPVMIHHAIMKADVRGATRVTQELMKQGLNPASYFSTRFFNPINALLPVYGAVKVFVEGDAIVLGVVEYDNAPQEWYSVARTCGLAKEILDLVISKNAHAKQTGLPLLEVGIGICYEDTRPMFLFDEQRPIMISPAIGNVEALAACEPALRNGSAAAFNGAAAFNVDVCEDGTASAGTGPAFVQYNVNGISLDVFAFNKLKSEIQLKKLKIKVGESAETMYVGKFPDVREKERELVIREGRVGRWNGQSTSPGAEDGLAFYEVLPNSRLASQVIEVARNQAAKAG